MKKIIIIGGVAGGASCAARLRRLDETAQITVLDRGPYVSFANCGLPYFVGGVIAEEADLLLATPELFRNRFNIEVRVHTEATSINTTSKTVETVNVLTGEKASLPYDALVLSPGASPLRPPLPGIDLPGIFTLRTVPDSVQVRDWVTQRKATSAAIIGGGFIGLEMAENLAHLGLKVTVIEMLDQLMPPMDPEMVTPIQTTLEAKGVTIALGDGVDHFEQTSDGHIAVFTKSGKSHPADLAILSIGVRPETALAKNAGLKIGERGGISVDDQMRTSDPSIWAVGDAIETTDWISGAKTVIPLAGPANRQGRVAADAICGRPTTYRGVQATAICDVFGMAIASTGASEKALKRAGVTDYEKIYLHPYNHVTYYPGAKKMHLKVIFRKSDGLILGAQGVGEVGVDRRIDVIATLIQKHGTVYDMEEAELCYSPQFGGAKDPINFAGMIASNTLRGDMSVGHWNEWENSGAFLLDARDPSEFAEGHHPAATNIQLHELRTRLAELPKDKEIWVYCAVGQRAYYAARLLDQRGFKTRVLPGGYSTWKRSV